MLIASADLNYQLQLYGVAVCTYIACALDWRLTFVLEMKFKYRTLYTHTHLDKLEKKKKNIQFSMPFLSAMHFLSENCARIEQKVQLKTFKINASY